MARFLERRFVKPVLLCKAEQRRLTQAVREILWPHEHLAFAYVYGSFARGEPCRDLDVALYTRKTPETFGTLELAVALQEATGFDVDVTIMNTAPVALRYAVLRDGQLLFSRDETCRTTYVERVAQQYWEYAHFRNVFLGVDGARPQ
jgi:predicted nucleotidyltransferase